MGEWKRVALGDLFKLRSGGTPSMSNPGYWNGEIPWVSCKDMYVDRVNDAMDHVTEEGARNGTRFAERGELLLVVRGMILAKRLPIAQVMRRVTFNQDLKCVSPAAGVDSGFLYYLIRSLEHELRGSTDEAAHGTKRLQTDRLLGATARVPGTATQKRIASVPTAYDDLIENNTRRIGVLEEMARVLYREWFGRPTAKNALPAGWERKTFGQFVSLRKDSVSPGDEPETDYDLFSFEARDLGSLPIATLGKSIQSNKFLVPEGVVLLPKLNPHIPRVWLPFLEGDRPKICSTEFLVLHPSPGIPRSFLYATLEDGSFSASLAQRADGTSNSHKRLKPDDVLTQPVVLPSRDLLGRFDEFATGVFEQCHLLRKKNHALRAARDLLLPKLLSGELSVDRIPDPAELAP